VKTSARPQPAASFPRPRLRAVSTAVVLRDLRREYDGREVVRGVSLEIQDGEIFGILGPNGAGKTTLLSMVSTRLRPTSGDVWVQGKHVVHDVDAARRLLNVAPQDEGLYPSLTADENLTFFAELYGVPRGARRAAVADALDAVGLTARKDDRV
jgi:ABC-2 type transport system ATP-binding protein